MAVTITQTANPAGVAASSNVATYSSVSIGTAASNRIIVVLVGTELSSSTPSGCTIGGQAMTAGTGGNQGISYSQLYYLAYPTGTTADIAVTYSSTNPGATSNHIAVYSVTDAVFSSTGADQSTDMDATDPLTTGSTTIGSGGGMLAIASCGADTQAKTWANLTEDIDADVGTFRFTTAYSTTAGTATRTCTGTGNGEDGALSWIIFADNTEPTTALNSPADAATGQTTTPTLNFTGTDTDSDAVEYNVQVDLTNFSTIDAKSSSGEKTSVSSITHSHTTGTLNKGLIVVLTQTRGTVAADDVITGITYNSLALTKARADAYTGGGTLRTEIWYRVAPSSGTHDVVVTYTGTVAFAEVQVVTLSGIDQTNPLDAVNGNNAVGQASPISNNITTVADNSWIFDSVYSKTGAAITKGASQTLLYQVAVNSSGDQTGASYIASSTPAGSTAMSWTYAAADDYAQTIASFKIDPTVNALSASDAGFTAGHPFASGAAKDYTVQSALSNSTTYYWRVRAIDPSGSNNYGAWSSTRSFTVTEGGGGSPTPTVGFMTTNTRFWS